MNFQRERESILHWSTLKFRTYRLKDIFEKIKTNKIKRNNSGNLWATTCTLSNNQLGARVNTEGATILNKAISVTANGTAKSFYQSHDFTVLQDSYALKLKGSKNISLTSGLYLITNLNNILSKYNWNNKSGWEKIKNEEISLPISSNNEINFDFIDTFINAIQKITIDDIKNKADKKLDILRKII